MSLGRLKSTYLNRLNDQYAQNWQASVSSSSRHQVLCELKKDFNISKYLLNIRDPLVRKTFTRLRIDLNILQECKSRQNATDSNNTTCPLCHSNNETVSHFLNGPIKFLTLTLNEMYHPQMVFSGKILLK